MTPPAKAAAVVAGWFAGNAVLAGVLPTFGEDRFAVVLYAASLALPAATAVVIWRLATGNTADEFVLRGGTGWVLPAAAGVVAIALGSIFGIWLIILGAATVLVAVARLVNPFGRREVARARS